MDDVTRFTFVVVIGTLFLLVLVGVMGFLMVVNTSRRARHRAELAEADRRRSQEVMHAEREAQQQTLQEIGRDLHDNLGQLLTVAHMGLDAVQGNGNSDPRIAQVMNTLEVSIDEVRRLGRSLNSDMWVDRSFSEALSAEGERIERAGLATVHLLVEGEAPSLSPDAKTILFRVFQEVLNNALKHAAASVIDVALRNGSGFTLTITDNGKGFDPAAVDLARATRRPSVLNHGNGLVNIRRRCELIGFTAELSTSPGKGCTWRFSQHSAPHAA